MFNEEQAGTNAQPQEHKHSWLTGILKQINTEFPLSGAETNNDLDNVFDHHESTPTQLHEHKHAWLHDVLGNINVQFPLSGGE